VPSIDSDAATVAHMRETILRLEAQVAALSAQLEDAAGSPGHSERSPTLTALLSHIPALTDDHDDASSGAAAAPSRSLRTMKTLLDDGTELSVRPDETAAMKAVFDMLDTDNDGVIDKKELVVSPRAHGKRWQFRGCAATMVGFRSFPIPLPPSLVCDPSTARRSCTAAWVSTLTMGSSTRR